MSKEAGYGSMHTGTPVLHLGWSATYVKKEIFMIYEACLFHTVPTSHELGGFALSVSYVTVH